MTMTVRTCILTITLLGGSLQPVRGEADHARLVRSSLQTVIRPAYDAFAKEAQALKAKTQDLCVDPSKATLAHARTAFAVTVLRWSAVEVFQFGPVNRDHRYERLFFWPDRKGLGLRQIQRALADTDETVTRASTLSKKSVALQGLPAIEYLLYGKGAEALAAPGAAGVFRCSFAAAVTDNIATVAQDVSEAWAPDAPFAKMLLEPGPDGSLYRQPKDVTLELYKAFDGGIERVGDQKLGRALGKSAERARPRLAPFWRSGLTFPNMAGNLTVVQALFVEGGFAEIVAVQSPGVEKSILFDLERATGVLQDEREPIAEAVKDPEQRAKLEALRVALKSARETASELITAGAGLSFGFNAADGD